jgi:hypothetical protein
MTTRATIVRIATAQPALMREAGAQSEAPSPLLVSGPPSVSVQLVQLLARDGDAGLVKSVGIRDLDDEGGEAAAALVYVIRGALSSSDERVLRAADWKRIPLIVVHLESQRAPRRILPYVLATDVIRAGTLGPELVDLIARRLTARAPEAAVSLAHRLPALRVGVAATLVSAHARRGATIGAVTRDRDDDRSALALDQIRMALRLSTTNGRALRPDQPIAIAAAATAVLAGRALERVCRGIGVPAPVAGAAIAYATTLAVGRVLSRRGR